MTVVAGFSWLSDVSHAILEAFPQVAEKAAQIDRWFLCHSGQPCHYWPAAGKTCAPACDILPPHTGTTSRVGRLQPGALSLFPHGRRGRYPHHERTPFPERAFHTHFEPLDDHVLPHEGQTQAAARPTGLGRPSAPWDAAWRPQLAGRAGPCTRGRCRTPSPPASNVPAHGVRARPPSLA